MRKSDWRKEVINEFRTGNPVIDGVATAGIAGQKTGKILDKFLTPKLNPLPKYKPIPQFQDIKKYKKGEDGVTKLYTDKELLKKKQERIKKAGELTVAPEKDRGETNNKRGNIVGAAPVAPPKPKPTKPAPGIEPQPDTTKPEKPFKIPVFPDTPKKDPKVDPPKKDPKPDKTPKVDPPKKDPKPDKTPKVDPPKKDPKPDKTPPVVVPEKKPEPPEKKPDKKPDKKPTPFKPTPFKPTPFKPTPFEPEKKPEKTPDKTPEKTPDKTPDKTPTPSPSPKPNTKTDTKTDTKTNTKTDTKTDTKTKTKTRTLPLPLLQRKTITKTPAPSKGLPLSKRLPLPLPLGGRKKKSTPKPKSQFKRLAPTRDMDGDGRLEFKRKSGDYQETFNHKISEDSKMNTQKTKVTNIITEPSTKVIADPRRTTSKTGSTMSAVQRIGSVASGKSKTAASSKKVNRLAATRDMDGDGRMERKRKSGEYQETLLYDVVHDYIITENFASDTEGANKIMLKLSDELMQEIYERTLVCVTDFNSFFRASS